MPLVFFETFGCQMNVADSDLVAEALARRGIVRTANRAEADLVVVNTCSVRAHAEQRAMARLREYAAAMRRARRKQAMWVIGCMAERKGESLREEVKAIDAVIGAGRIEFIEQCVDGCLAECGIAAAPPAPRSFGGLSVFVPVMRGCDNYCSYCIVPYVRGREHSVDPAEIERRVRELVREGAREVTLLGQNVNSYCHGNTDFPALLGRVHGIEGLMRLRFVTSHPKDCSDELIRTVAGLAKCPKHIHLPVQSGSTKVLSFMNRTYTRDDYLSRIEMIRREMPEADITTDILVGFPGEEHDDFVATESLVREVRFTAAFMFAYSPRPGTAACSMADTVPDDEKKRRLNRIIELQTRITKQHYAAMVGRDIDVLITGRQESGKRLWMGQDGGAKSALVSCSDDISGMILHARVATTTGMTLVCERTGP